MGCPIFCLLTLLYEIIVLINIIKFNVYKYTKVKNMPVVFPPAIVYNYK